MTTKGCSHLVPRKDKDGTGSFLRLAQYRRRSWARKRRVDPIKGLGNVASVLGRFCITADRGLGSRGLTLLRASERSQSFSVVFAVFGVAFGAVLPEIMGSEVGGQHIASTKNVDIANGDGVVCNPVGSPRDEQGEGTSASRVDLWVKNKWMRELELVNGTGNPWVNFSNPHPYPQTLTRETRGFFAKNKP
ncbi:hypothetical protein CPC08DRAFT_754729 [Agrocybe pediades]|nr:hypothetical protein CPC08DRAFT_754729 [Agrocybe pediades]